MSKLNELAEYGYNQDVFKSWLQVASDHEFVANSEIDLSNKDDDYFTGFKMLGDAKFDKDSIIVVSTNSTKPLTETSSKRKQYDKAKEILKENNKYVAGLFVFYDSENRFRLSFVYQESLGTKRKFSNFKRYTYFVSPAETNKTFKQQLSEINFSKGVGGVQDAFSIDKVTREFFKEYLKFFEKFVGEFNQNEDFVKNIVEDKRITTTNFVKKMLGQIVFLYFIQKKGWLGVKENEEWGTGDQKFISNLLKECIDGEGLDKENKGKNFYNDYLEYLFFDTLANPDRGKENWSEYFKCRIPYLNGGLFDDFYDWQSTKIEVSNENLKDLIEFLDQYNFTVDENTPDDQEVSIDPEMLGRIFESLIGVEERKSKGAFYTPREIVQYMCRESIKEYLKTKKFDTKVVGDLVDDTLIGEKLKLINIDEIEKIDSALQDMKVLDPAIGSGAFPIGILKEITRIRLLIKFLLNEKGDTYNIKKEILEKNIYGVDIDSGAIEIARLRAWLSLVVDYDVKKHKGKIEPLPNLDFKFVCANTLIPLDSNTESYLDSGNQGGLFDKDFLLKDKLTQLRKGYYLATTKKDKEKIQKEYKEYTNFGHLLASKREKQLFEYDPFTPMGQSSFYDPDLMHGVNKFDLVIGNPPYVQLQKNNGELANLYKDLSFNTFERTGDIYSLFYENGLELTKKGTGLLCYITSNKWMRAGYGRSLREYFLSKNPVILIDLGPGIFETATVDTNILLIQNSENTNKFQGVTLTKDYSKEGDISYFINNKSNKLKVLNSGPWYIGSEIEQRIKEKIEKVGKPLKDWDVQINYGIKTGLNEAFIIDEETKTRLIKECSSSEEIIKPILRGRDIKRYSYNFANLYIINTHNGVKAKNMPRIDIDKYPAVKKHLDRFEPKLSKRQDKGDTKYNLRNCAYINEFEKDKIIFPNMASRLSSYLDLKKYYTNQKCFIMTGEKIKYIYALFNSELMFWYFKRTGATLGSGGFEMSKIFIELLPFKEPNNREEDSIEEMIKKVSSELEVENIINRIDDFVFDLYDLDQVEIDFIKNETK